MKYRTDYSKVGNPFIGYGTNKICRFIACDAVDQISTVNFFQRINFGTGYCEHIYGFIIVKYDVLFLNAQLYNQEFS